MTFKALLKEIDLAAENWLPLLQPVDEAIILWASLHGWDVLSKESQRLLVRQALFNATLQQITPDIKRSLWGTPLDRLGIEPPQSLTSAVKDLAQHPQNTQFNFWGEFYSLLIPQAQRRQIGQFWTNELIAEWMIDWLLQSQPQHLADIGCGAGNFLLKATQQLARQNDFPKLYGCDVSPLLLNVTLAAFLNRYSGQLPLMPALVVQDYLAGSLPPNIDALVCNPPYTPALLKR